MNLWKLPNIPKTFRTMLIDFFFQVARSTPLMHVVMTHHSSTWLTLQKEMQTELCWLGRCTILAVHSLLLQHGFAEYSFTILRFCFVTLIEHRVASCIHRLLDCSTHPWSTSVTRAEFRPTQNTHVRGRGTVFSNNMDTHRQASVCPLVCSCVRTPCLFRNARKLLKGAQIRWTHCLIF